MLNVTIGSSPSWTSPIQISSPGWTWTLTWRKSAEVGGVQLLDRVVARCRIVRHDVRVRKGCATVGRYAPLPTIHKITSRRRSTEVPAGTAGGVIASQGSSGAAGRPRRGEHPPTSPASSTSRNGTSRFGAWASRLSNVSALQAVANCGWGWRHPTPTPALRSRRGVNVR